MSPPLAFDVIGDVHGQAGKLEALLARLGYREHGTRWTAPTGRQAVFVGDLIDRGPQQVRTVAIVRSMVDTGAARAVLGNHELNAIGFVTEALDAHGKRTGRTLRTRTDDHVKQHAEFLRQVGEGSALHRELVDWFRTLPLALDLGGIRVVHAWWHDPHLEAARDAWAGAVAGPAGSDGKAPMTDAFLRGAFAKHTPLWDAVEGLTKGMEVPLPPGWSFTDNHGIERRHVRTRWWDSAGGSYRDVALLPEHQRHRLPDLPLAAGLAVPPVTGSPVFVGHYWMPGAPARQSERVACVDYAAGLDGPLVAYRWDGEGILDDAKFVSVG